MVDYIWNNKKLKKMKDELTILGEKGNVNAINDLKTLEMMQKNELGNNLEMDIIYDTEIDYMIKKYAEAFYQKSLTKHMYLDSLPLINLDIKDYLLLVHDFYRTHNTNFYEAFLKEYNKKSTNLQVIYDFKSHAMTYHFSVKNESYIEIFLNNTPLDLANIPHEYAHATTFLINNDFVTNPNFLFIRELDGYYFQTNFFDYLIENNILKEEALLAKISIDFMMYIKARYLALEKYDLKQAVRFYSYLTSLELSMYDNQVADELLERIIKQNPKTISESIEFLNDNLTLGKSIDHFQKKLKVQMDQYLK